jgi:hypothetical protein
MRKRKNRETIAANYSKAIGRLMLYEGPEEQIVQNIESCAIFLAGVRKSSTLLRPVYEGICRRDGLGVHQIPGGEGRDVDPAVLRRV